MSPKASFEPTLTPASEVAVAHEAIHAVLHRLRHHHPIAHVAAETQTASARSRQLLHRLGFTAVDTYQRKGAEQTLHQAR